MSTEILLIVTATAFIQSFFGAGMLLLGTPLLLLLGYEFVDILLVLLPISLAINLFQLAQYYQQVNLQFYRKILLLTLPPIAIFLFLVTHFDINLSLFIGIFLLLIALKDYSVPIANVINKIMHYETGYFLLVGIIHGLSNLGGSLLTALVYQKNYPKEVARVTIAACYATFAVVQLLTLWLFKVANNAITFSETSVYLVIGVLVYTLSNEIFFINLEAKKFQRYFSVFLALAGITLLIKSTL